MRLSPSCLPETTLRSDAFHVCLTKTILCLRFPPQPPPVWEFSGNKWLRLCKRTLALSRRLGHGTIHRTDHWKQRECDRGKQLSHLGFLLTRFLKKDSHLYENYGHKPTLHSAAVCINLFSVSSLVHESNMSQEGQTLKKKQKARAGNAHVFKVSAIKGRNFLEK